MGSQIYDLLSVSIPESAMQSIGQADQRIQYRSAMQSISQPDQPCNRTASQISAFYSSQALPALPNLRS